MTVDWAEAAARLFEPVIPKWDTPGEMAVALDPKTMQTAAMKIIDEALVWAFNTPDARLMLSMPPQAGKSQRAVRRFAAWVLSQNPDTRITVCSYNTDTARRWGRVIRDDVTEHGDDMGGLKVRNDVASQSEWLLDGHEGGVFTAGVGSSLTGRPSDCISGDTHILCEYGEISAEQAFALGIQWILAYDHAAGKPVWRNVEATRRIPSRRVIEIRTTGNRVLTCTPDHRIHTSRGYVPAGSVRAGEEILGLVDDRAMRMRGNLGNPEDGSAESDSAGTQSILLGTLRDCRNRELAPVQDLHNVRRTSPKKRGGDLLQGMSGRAQGEESQGKGLPAMRPDVPGQEQSEGLLLTGMRESSALTAHDRGEQLPIQGRNELRQMVPNNAPIDHGARRRALRGLRVHSDHDLHPKREPCSEIGSGDSPSQREAVGQPGREPDYPLPGVPYGAPQVERDTVSMVRSLGDTEISVYDFQVAGTRNFFGNGVLVHNCMIVDDPVKGREDADSERYQERNWDWWREVAMTRLAPGAPAILVMTRWATEDLGGKVLKAENGGEEWRVVNIPAQANHRPELGETDPLGREPGEWMETTRGMTEAQWERRKRDTGPRSWAALYQGSPTPDEGGIFPRDWATYDEPLWTVREDGAHLVPGIGRDDHELAASWDLTFSDGKNADFVVGQVWLRVGNHAYLLDQVRRRMNFNDTCEAMLAMKAKWPQCVQVFVENKANGPAVINALQQQIMGLIPIEPEGSKSARASAVSPLAFSKNIVLPTAKLLPNVEDLREELVNFPSKHDDTVDALSQAINRLLLMPLLNPDQRFVNHDVYEDHDSLGWSISPV